MMALCLMTLLTGCEETDKALVFTSESLAQEADAAQQGEIPMYEPGVMWQQTASGIGEADDRETGVTGTAGLIYVHVCGAVLASGVVEVPAGSRAEDALDAAGARGISLGKTILRAELAASIAIAKVVK